MSSQHQDNRSLQDDDLQVCVRDAVVLTGDVGQYERDPYPENTKT